MGDDQDEVSVARDALHAFLRRVAVDASRFLWQSQIVRGAHAIARGAGAFGAVAAVAAHHVSAQLEPWVASAGAIVAVSEHALSRVLPNAERAQRLGWYAEDLRLLVQRVHALAEATRHLVPGRVYARDLAVLLRSTIAERDRLARLWRVWEQSEMPAAEPGQRAGAGGAAKDAENNQQS